MEYPEIEVTHSCGHKSIVHEAPGPLVPWECPDCRGHLFDIAREVTDEVFGEGTYADMNKSHPNPDVQAAIKRARDDD